MQRRCAGPGRGKRRLKKPVSRNKKLDVAQQLRIMGHHGVHIPKEDQAGKRAVSELFQKRVELRFRLAIARPDLQHLF